MTGEVVKHDLPVACRCGSMIGYLLEKGPHVELRCIQCETHQKFVKRVDAGLKPRTLTTTHDAIKPKLRAKILQRANGHCELCGCRRELQVGHLVSVDAGHKLGMTDDQINDAENLSAMCGECNIGVGKEPLPLRFCMSLALCRIAYLQENGQ